MKLKKPKESKITMEEFTKLCAEPIDWEQRRYEIAKAVLSNPAFIRTDKSEIYEVFYVDASVKTALKVADKLIEELKGY